ncbi:MAG: F0F1 ATP synthase subunit delta [Actinobacteria bacterium]|jgi:F-type H+-transporting ATPase subunit delta|nr:F0F1 ATP synthase subunit delta [Actinomycetota bacterium]
MKVLGGSSRASVLALRKTLSEVVNKQLSAELAQFANDLFVILSVLSSSIGVRRALTDNARDASAKAELISNLFGKNISSAAQSLLASAAALRWSSPGEIADAIENLAVEAESAVADKNGELEKLENQLFDFARVLKANPDLRQALNTSADTDAGKLALLETVVKGKYASSTLNLLRRVVTLRRGRSIDATLAAYSHYVSSRKDRLVAHVKSAVELTPSQIEKLVAALTKQMGRPVHINLEIDPKVLGGISIRYADDVIDGTIVNRIAEAGRALVS